MGARAWLILASLSLARITFGYQYQTVASLAPQLIERYGLDYTGLGTLIGVFVAPGILLALPLGLLGRRLGEGVVVGAGLALLAAGPLVSAYAGTAQGVGAGRVVAGAGAVAMIVLQNKIISDWFSGRLFMVAISLSIAAYPIGVAAAQIVVPPLATAHGVAGAFLSNSTLAAATAILFLASYRTGPGASPAPRSFRLPSRRECVLVMVAGLAWTAYTGSYGGFVSYVPSLLAARGDPGVLTAIVMAIVTLGSVPPTLAGGPLAARLGIGPPMLAGTLALAAGSLGMALTSWPVASALVFGVLGSLHSPLIMAAGTLSARPENRAVGMGLFYTTYYAGNAVAPALCGYAADASGGPAGAFYAAAAIGMLVFPIWRLHAGLSGRPQRRLAAKPVARERPDPPACRPRAGGTPQADSVRRWRFPG